MTSRCAVVTARGLGDALLSMIVSQNLLRSGHHVTTFSNILCQMESWFPEHTIRPYTDDLSPFDRIIAADHSSVRKEDARTTILWESGFDKQKTMVANLAAASQKLGLTATTNTGIKVPSHLTHRKYPMRVILHPMSAAAHKNWPAHKFRYLAKKLHSLGYDPVLCVSPQERTEWPESPLFPTASELAAFIYESGALIGNDSGLGHLASLLDIPTLSLFARKSYAQLWRPGWNVGAVVTPYIPLIGAPMKQRYWKNFLTAKQVIYNFKHLVKTS
ncbi:MAG: hypothetical protein H7A36_02515 [Chlamydiales bacterium]|nr:hypothetical protein [Chlamydiales bacterium]